MTGPRVRLTLTLALTLVAAGAVGLTGCSSPEPAVSAPPALAPTAAPAAAADPDPWAHSMPVQVSPALSPIVYRSPDGYSFRPPAAWVMHPTGGQQGVSAFFSAPAVDPAAQKPFVDNINVAIQPTTQTLEELIADTKAKYPSYLSNYHVVADQPVTTPSGHAAHILSGTYDAPGVGPSENVQLTLVEAGKAYTVTFTSPQASFATYHELVRASIYTFALG